jgi:hypothetical protein
MQFDDDKSKADVLVKLKWWCLAGRRASAMVCVCVWVCVMAMVIAILGVCVCVCVLGSTSPKTAEGRAGLKIDM